MKNKQAKINKQIKKERKESVKKTNHKWVHWQCKSCNRIVDIMISPRNVELFTKEREKKYICLNCK